MTEPRGEWLGRPEEFREKHNCVKPSVVLQPEHIAWRCVCGRAWITKFYSDQRPDESVMLWERYKTLDKLPLIEWEDELR